MTEEDIDNELRYLAKLPYAPMRRQFQMLFKKLKSAIRSGEIKRNVGEPCFRDTDAFRDFCRTRRQEMFLKLDEHDRTGVPLPSPKDLPQGALPVYKG